MSALAATYAVLRRDFQLELSYRFRFVTQLASALFSIALFYYISRLVRVGFNSPGDYFAFAVIGIVIFQVLHSALMMPPMILRQELVAGTWERIVLSPFGAVRASLATMIFPIVRACVMGVVTVTLAAAVFGMPVHWSTAALALPVAILATTAFVPFGMFTIAVVMVAKQLMSGATWALTAISLVGGLYFPIALLPGWIRWTSDVQPFTPSVDLMRHLLVGTPLAQSAWVEVGKLFAFAAVLLPVSIAATAAALRLTRRRGTIIEY